MPDPVESVKLVEFVKSMESHHPVKRVESLGFVEMRFRKRLTGNREGEPLSRI